MPWPQRLYASRRWLKTTRLLLRVHPLCAQCEREGRTEIAVLTHHVNEHQPGDHETRFWAGPFESLCYGCHLKIHGKPEPLPYRRDIGLDGQPLDPLHPYWQAERRQQQEQRTWTKTKPKP